MIGDVQLDVVVALVGRDVGSVVKLIVARVPTKVIDAVSEMP